LLDNAPFAFIAIFCHYDFTLLPERRCTSSQCDVVHLVLVDNHPPNIIPPGLWTAWACRNHQYRAKTHVQPASGIYQLRCSKLFRVAALWPASAPLLREQIARGKPAASHYTGIWTDVRHPATVGTNSDKQLRATHNTNHD